MPMTYPEAKFWFDVLQGIVTAALVVTVWLRKPGTDAGKAVELLKQTVADRFDAYRVSHDAELQGQRARITEIEAHMEHMPTSEELRELEGTVKQIAERTLGMNERMGTMASTMARIEHFLLTKGKP